MAHSANLDIKVSAAYLTKAPSELWSGFNLGIPKLMWTYLVSLISRLESQSLRLGRRVKVADYMPLDRNGRKESKCTIPVVVIHSFWN
jgi:hypothetical protein